MNLRKIIREEFNRAFTDIHGKNFSDVEYTGVILEGSQEAKFEYEIGNRLSALGIDIPIDWKIPENYHMTITLGEVGLRLKMTGIIDEEVELEIYSIGVSDEAIAAGVRGMYSKGDIQHITIAFRDKSQNSNLIIEWVEINPFKVIGHIKEVKRKNKEFGKLDESYGQYASKPLPVVFNHLKWKLSNNQKYYLDGLCSVNPDSINESDIKSASKFLGIPEKNVKSILNTYNYYDAMSEAKLDVTSNSNMVFGNKLSTAKDFGLTSDDSRLPDLNPSGKIMVTQPEIISKLEDKYKNDAEMLNRTWYRGSDEHPSKQKEKIYENLTQSLMLYLYCESSPIDINLRHNNKIQIDFNEPIKEGFNKLVGGLNYESEKYIKIKNLLEEFNQKFNCKFVIYDHINIDEGQRIFIEHNITKQIDMAEDSVKMMKKFLLPKVIAGYKIEKSNQHIAEFMGLDAGDTSWLYGPTSKSDLYTKK